VLALAPAAARAAASLQRDGEPGVVAVWDGESGALLRTLPLAATAVAFSPDGRLLSAGDAAGQVRLWALPGGEEVGSFRAGNARIHGLAVSPDGTSVAAAGEGSLLLLWNR